MEVGVEGAAEGTRMERDWKLPAAAAQVGLD